MLQQASLYIQIDFAESTGISHKSAILTSKGAAEFNQNSYAF